MLKSCIKNWKRIDDDMAADVAQRECSKIKCYASTFRERERERGFCEWKNRNYAWNKRGNDNFIV